MHPDLRKWLAVTLGVLVFALLVTLATKGTISDIAFYVYAAAFIATIVVGVLVIVDYFRSRKGPA